MTRLARRLEQCAAMYRTDAWLDYAYACEYLGLLGKDGGLCPCPAYQRGLSDRATLLKLDRVREEPPDPPATGRASRG